MRVERIAAEIKREISTILDQELKDPRIGFVTIIDVDVSGDLKNVKVYFSVLGGEAKGKASLKGLNNASGFIRKLIGQRLGLRFSPEIIFKFDKTIAYQIKIEQIMDEIRNEKKD